MMFQIMLPTCFALTREEFEATKDKDGYYEYDGKEYKKVIPSRTGWYDVGSWAMPSIFYFDENGNMIKPTSDKYHVEGGQIVGGHDNYIVYLYLNKVYYVE